MDTTVIAVHVEMGATTLSSSKENETCATLNSGGNTGGFRTEPGEHLIVSDQSVMRSELVRGGQMTTMLKVAIS